MDKKLLDSGEKNQNYVDMLDEDKTLSNQKFVCLSFVSPENILKQKNMYYFEAFVKYYDSSKSVEKYHQFLNFLAYKYNIKLDELRNQYKLFIDEEHENLLNTTIEDDYKNFVEARGDDLQREFSAIHEFQTNTRGIKVRGSYSSQKEAELRAKTLREIDKNHDIYVGEVGKWMPFNPDAYKTGNVQYLEDELNSIMNYKANQEEIEKVNFDERVLQSKRDAVSNNIKLAKETGNKLTQQLDKSGNIVK